MVIDLDAAQESADICCGINAPELRYISRANAVDMREQFLKFVVYRKGAASHKHIINVLQFMTPYIV